jgi:hypothetical protein
MRWYTMACLFLGGTGMVHTPGHSAITSLFMVLGLMFLNQDLNRKT